jgi:hypothetical protein
MPDSEFRVLSPSGILGYGFPEASFRRGIDRRPHLIACDAGSTDPGPYYLGSGKSFTDRALVKRDLQWMLCEGLRIGSHVIVGSAGGSGATPHLAWCREILTEIAQETSLSFRLGVIHADIGKDVLRRSLQAGKIRPLPYVPDLTEDAIRESTHLVAQMGCEPLMKALRAGCQVILAGRCYDPANFAALPILRGYDEGLALHMGKILECGAIAATPGSGADCVLGTLTRDSFVLESLNPLRQFTCESAAAHTLYEKSDPYHLPGPGGVIHLDQCAFRDVGNGRVEVRGSRHERTVPYCIKVEGARLTGYRAISMAGVRDPLFIAQCDTILSAVRAQVQSMLIDSRSGQLFFHLYGRDGVMGPGEPVRQTTAHELGILIEAVAPTQEQANSLVSLTRSTLLHYGYPGRISTAGNLAFPFSPSDFAAGAVYEFSVYHLMEQDAPDDFPLEVQEFVEGRCLP